MEEDNQGFSGPATGFQSNASAADYTQALGSVLSGAGGIIAAFNPKIDKNPIREPIPVSQQPQNNKLWIALVIAVPVLLLLFFFMGRGRN